MSSHASSRKQRPASGARSGYAGTGATRGRDGPGQLGVLAEDGWHAGVIGIVASRIVEEFGRPALLISIDGEEGKGSGRSIPAFDLHSALTECREACSFALAGTGPRLA